jgi:hypothetical protein
MLCVVLCWAWFPNEALCTVCATRCAWFRPNARRAGVVRCRRGSQLRTATRTTAWAAEHAYAADRFAREIVGVLTVFLGALAAADRQPVSLTTAKLIERLVGEARSPIM